MKKLNQYLLTHFPLIWNLRLIYVLPAVLIIHSGFYLAGYLKPVLLVDLKMDRVFEIYPQIMFSVLVTSVLLILWLLFFLRNNPFKSFYPIKKGRTFMEFILCTLVFFSSSTFFLTYQQGLYDNVKRMTREVDLEQEVNKANQAMMFIPTENYSYRIENCCDSIEARKAHMDSVRRAGGIFESENSSDGVIEEVAEYPGSQNTVSSIPLSFLYYCGTEFHNGNEKQILTARQISDRGKSWILNGQRDSLMRCFQEFDQLLKTYDIERNIDYQDQVNRVFKEGAEVDTFFDKYDEYYYVGGENIKQAYLQVFALHTALDRITEVRIGFWHYGYLMVMLYYSLSMAVLLLSFRLVKLRLWFTALVSFGVMCIVYILLVSTARMKDAGNYILYFSLFALIAGLTIYWILNSKNKRLSAVGLLWFIWNLPSLVPLIYGFLMELYNYNSYDDIHYEQSMQYWLREHQTQMGWWNMIWILLALYLILIPLARKWHSNPEE
ncbi:MAG: hypothetical protein GC180_05485 [Bacteroidetes bacterium]|nr:hypothetical protein [Bacteroidota bacterium]